RRTPHPPAPSPTPGRGGGRPPLPPWWGKGMGDGGEIAAQSSRWGWREWEHWASRRWFILVNTLRRLWERQVLISCARLRQIRALASKTVTHFWSTWRTTGRGWNIYARLEVMGCSWLFRSAY